MLHFIKLKNGITLYFIIILSLCCIRRVYSADPIVCEGDDDSDDGSVKSYDVSNGKLYNCSDNNKEVESINSAYYISYKSSDSLKLIKCDKIDGKIKCTESNAKNDGIYINGDDNEKLIFCSENSCSVSDSDIDCPAGDDDGSDGGINEEDDLGSSLYFINSGNTSNNKLEGALIKCTQDECNVISAKANDVYINAACDRKKNPLIKCTNNGCKSTYSNASNNINEYYLNADDTESNSIIECYKDEDENINCTTYDSDKSVGVYLNSNYSENGDKNQLIHCGGDNGCEGMQITEKSGQYYVYAGTDYEIVYCSNKKCELQNPSILPSYYVGIGENGDVNGLIECLESNDNEDDSNDADPEKQCNLRQAFDSQGYYLNYGYNKSTNQTIICDSTDGCQTIKVDLGYYVNAGEDNDNKPIIKCEKEGAECVLEDTKDCPESKDALPGNYCYDGQLKFYPASNSTAVSASRSDDYYTFATIQTGGFPGVKSETGTFFKISQYYIVRFYQSGIIMIDRNGRLVDNLSDDQSDITLYECNETTKTCSERPGCTNNTYMYDPENKKVVFCNAGRLEYAEFTGYVIDTNRAIGSNHPYIIKCENNGNNCISIKPKTASYYVNSGYDSNTNTLIQCSNNNCITVPAEVGYYVAHEGEGILQCTTTSNCIFSKPRSNVKYVNAGANKTSNAIISCIKNEGCSSIRAKIGYYLTYTNSLLIQCTSPSSCVEFTPTVNYYDNADSSESGNTIINCVQTSQVVSCALESTNTGFYMSSSPNVLIRCKSGSKCKTVVVKNGIFRGAIKGLLGGSKRAIKEEKEVENEKKEVNLNEDKSKIAVRDSEDVYGIIRCIAGKCSALSASEVAAIPICEFNNNKCYITNEYAMTKTATTSISAGNICTNEDRSVFYFATDTVVVKPNIISGVTTTYIYTTTNSNCLEVNDSYNDMYFTVGSNIYLLDQGSVLQFYETGYYFINTSKNALISGNDIDAYNDENVKLYKCNGSSCTIVDKPNTLTYYADVNKHIIKYNINSDTYSFAYDKDITCIFANNKCTPNADLKNQEFCITYKGELALAKQDIKNRETGECYKAGTISNSIYGYSQYLYNMNLYSASMIDETGYYIISLSTNTTVVNKNYKNKNNNLVIYGCQLSSCKEVIPDEDVYYYDARAKNILKYKDGVWSSPSSSGYAYISIDPVNTYIYRFTKNLDTIEINGIANYGYYYTVDNEMYRCDRDENGDCSKIKNTDYYFTNAGEVYYCVYDSEELEPTECTKQGCISGQYYYIDEAYYRCESNSILLPVMSRYCSFTENVVINYPIALTKEYPDKIKQAIENIEKNNNSTAIARRRGKNYLDSVSGVFTNCTYNVEEVKSKFDLVCVNNYVNIDDDTKDAKICSIEQLGYVECIEDEDNTKKCNVSGSLSRFSISTITMIVALVLSIIFVHRN